MIEQMPETAKTQIYVMGLFHDLAAKEFIAGGSFKLQEKGLAAYAELKSLHYCPANLEILIDWVVEKCSPNADDFTVRGLKALALDQHRINIEEYSKGLNWPDEVEEVHCDP